MTVLLGTSNIQTFLWELFISNDKTKWAGVLSPKDKIHKYHHVWNKIELCHTFFSLLSNISEIFNCFERTVMITVTWYCNTTTVTTVCMPWAGALFNSLTTVSAEFTLNDQTWFYLGLFKSQCNETFDVKKRKVQIPMALKMLANINLV